MRKENMGPTNTHFLPQGSEKQASVAEAKVVRFLAEHNLSFATVDHLGLLFKSIFPDSKIATAYSCGKTSILYFKLCFIVFYCYSPRFTININ